MESVHIIPGDHLCYSCGAYSHHGIYCGDISYKDRNYKDVVIHYEGKHKRGQIRGLSYEKFALRRKVYVMQYQERRCFPRSTTVARALNKLGEPDYNLLGNNCEHFAHWCKTGKRTSGQVNEAFEFAAGGAGGLGGAVAAGIAVDCLPFLVVPGVNGICLAVAVGVAAGYGGVKIGELAAQFILSSADYEKSN